MKYISRTRFFILTAILTLLFSFLAAYAKNVNRDLAGSMVRLHIIANSDSDADQALKLRVRDRLLHDAAYIFEDSTSPADALLAAKQNTELIKQIAADEISKQGYSYDVSVQVGKFAFPTKAYRDIMLPSGKYNAVRVVIGSGSGHNWWCVMYPPLCFTDGVVSVPDSARDKLRESLSESDYKLICGKDSGAVPVEVRFKIVELLQNIF